MCTMCIHIVILGSIGWGCVCCAVSMVLWLIMAWEDCCIEAGLTASNSRPNSVCVEETDTALSLLLQSFVFLPIFFIIDAFQRANNEWLSWLGAAHACQDSFRDMALHCGSQLQNPNDPVARGQLHTICHCSNLVQWNSLHSCDAPLVTSMSEKDFVRLRLLTQQELKILSMAQSDQIPWIVVSWLTSAISEHFALKESVKTDNTNLMKDILATANPFKSHKDRLTPNIVTRTMFLLGLSFLMLVIASFPFSRLVCSNAPLLPGPCFQPVTLFGASLFAAGIQLTMMGLFLLKDPFSFPSERLRVDCVLDNTDRAMFALLRVNFTAVGEKDSDMDNNNHREVKSEQKRMHSGASRWL